MRYSEPCDYYEDLIRRGSAELTVVEEEGENKALRDFLRKVIILRVLRG